MRILCVLVLTCAFPLVALSQIPPDKAIIDDYAHPRFARMVKADTAILDPSYHIYLVAAPAAVFRQPVGFVLLRQLSPRHAVIKVDVKTFAAGNYGFAFMMPANDAWKMSPGLLEDVRDKRDLRVLVGVSEKGEKGGKEMIGDWFGEKVILLKEYSKGVLIVKVADRAALWELLASDRVLFADAADRRAKEELSVSGFDLGTNNINTAHHYFPGITGDGLLMSVKENRFDSNDIDLKGRVLNSSFASTIVSGHATIVATMIAGAGNSFYDGKGAAHKANLQSASFTNLLPEPDTFYRNQGISVQNHSYGVGIENFYGADAGAYDAVMANNPVLMHVFSSGNSGLLPSSGPYAGLTGFANITGSFKMGKNMLVVGAIDSVGNAELPSSRGPAYDGRIKPELVAFGQDGSSGAAAIVSGIALLAQQAYKQLHQDSLPPSALLKSILINTADDVAARGPDFASGYGKANAYRALHSVQQSQFFAGSVQQGNTQIFNLNTAPGISSLKLTLAWTDPPAQANAAKALVNNLDMELTHVPSGQTWHPWILSSFPHKDSLQALAIRGRDTLNNIEQITLDTPLPGNYTITIKGSRVVNAAQAYFIAYQADTANTFQWMYPMAADPVQGGTSIMSRWHATFTPGTTGTLQYNLTNGSAWQTAATNVDLSKGYARWNAPDTFSTALLRMVIGSNSHAKDTFVISKLISTQVGFNCPDSFLFYWKRPAGVNSFRIYQRGSEFLEPVAVTADTFFIASKNAFTARQFTLAPLVDNREGIKAYAFDYSTQGVGCYFKAFLAQLDGSKAQLQLQLGSVYRVSTIMLQKLSGNVFTTIQTINAPAALQFDFTDATLTQGVNTYRVALQLQDGRIIYSSTEVVYYLDTKAYLVYPNPASITGGFRILQSEPAAIRVLMHDATGRLVKDELHQDLVVAVSTFNLQKGLYFVTVVKDGKAEFRGKVVIAR